MAWLYHSNHVTLCIWTEIFLKSLLFLAFQTVILDFNISFKDIQLRNTSGPALSPQC